MSKESLENSISHSWSLFDVDWGTKSLLPERNYSFTINGYENPIRPKLHLSNERTIIASLYTRIATDVSAIPIKHVRVNQNGTYQSTIDSSLNECLNVEANVDQTGRELIFDATMSMFDEGSIALVPVETNESIINHNTFDVVSLRTGKIVGWAPTQVQIELYNERTGNRETIWLEKSKVAILQNPFFAVMNEKGSVAKRLIHKLDESDAIDAKNASSKLDMFLQVPYATKSSARKRLAEERVTDITNQIQNSQYGIAYIDSTEKVTPINRAIENTLPNHIQWLTELLYSQLGISKKILDGTADEQESLNYYNQTVEPVLATICNEIKRKFLTKTARTQGQDIMYFRNSFGLVPVNNIADIADKFTRNEILSSNEMRAIVGYKPVDDERADELRNKNINQSSDDIAVSTDNTEDLDRSGYEQQIADIDSLLNQLDEAEVAMDLKDEKLAHYASPYYDPVKAHEYYERTKKLKGRTKSVTLNDKGKEASKYVKEQIEAEKNQKINSSKVNMQNEVNRLTSLIGSLSGKNLKAQRARIKSQIQSLRERFKAEKESLKQEYKEKYDKELESIRSEKSFVKTSKRKSK